MGGFFRRFSTTLLNQASEGMEAQQAADAKVASEIKVREGKLYDKYLDSYFEMKKTMFENPEKWSTTHSGVTMNWQQAEPIFMDRGLLKVDNLSNLKNTVDLLSNFKPEAIDDKTSKTWEKLLAGIVTRTNESAAYSREITDLHGKVTEQFWKDAQTTKKWKGIFTKETSDEAFKFFAAFKKVGEPKGGKEGKSVATLFENIPAVTNKLSYNKNDDSPNSNNTKQNLLEFDKMFLNQGKDLFKTYSSLDDTARAKVLTEVLAESEALSSLYIEVYKDNKESYADGYQRQSYLAKLPSLQNNLLSSLYDMSVNSENKELQLK